MQYVGAVVGAVVGFYVGGGPTGAFYGAEIGYTIGSVIAASNSKITTEGPRLSDLKTTFSSNGQFIPRIYVRAGGIGGNIIDGSSLVPAEHTTETSGKGGPTTDAKTTTYSASFMVLLCQSFGDRQVITIKANGVVIWSRAAGIDAASQLATQDLVKRITVYNGAQDQLPDPTLEAIHGVGNVPAYRGRLCVMFEDFQLANYSNNIEATMLTFEVVEGTEALQVAELCRGGTFPMLDAAGYWAFNPDTTGGTLPNGLNLGPQADPYGQWAASSTGGLGTEFVDNPDRGLSGQFWLDALDGSGPLRQSSFVTLDQPIATLLVDQPVGFGGCPPATYAVGSLPARGFDGTVIAPVAMVWRLVHASHIQYDPFTVYRANGVYGNPADVECSGVAQTLIDDGDASVHFYSPAGVGQAIVRIDRVDVFRANYFKANDAQRFALAAANAGDAYVYVEATGSGFVGSSKAVGSYLAIKTDGELAITTIVDKRICGLTATAARIYVLTEHFDSQALWRYDCEVYDALTGDHRASWPGPSFSVSDQGFRNRLFSIFLVDGKLVVPGTDGNGAGYLWDWDDVGTLHVESTSMVDATTERFLTWDAPDQYVSTGRPRVVGAEGAYQVTSVAGGVITPNPGRPLREIITELAAEKGVTLTSYSFQQLPDTVTCEGYVVTRQTSPRVAIDFLRDLYRVDCAESGLIKFVLRGGDVVRALTTDDLGAMEGDDGDPPQAVEWTIADELIQPAAVNLKYCDRENNFEIGTAIARRETTASQTLVTLDASAVMMTGTQAARLAEQALTDQRLAAETAKFQTLYAHEDLETADPIMVPGKFKNRRVRIDGKTDKGGMVEWTAVRDDPASLSQYVIGGSVANNGGGSSIVSGTVTRVDILNLPLLRNVDDEGGYYVFAYPSRIAGYRGADVYDRTNYVPNKIGSVDGTQKPRGFATTVLGADGQIGSFDLSAFVDVQFPNGTALESVTRDRIAAGKNVFLIGNEICGVCQTTSLGSDVWRLHGGILRGMRGTEAAIARHAVGDRVYLLNALTLIRDRTASESGSADVTLSVGAVTQGRGLGDLKTYATSATNTSQALATFAPINLAYGEDGGGGLIFRWTRRTRLIFDFGNPAPLGEDDERYAIDFSSTANFADGVTLYSTSSTLKITADQRRILPAPFKWRARQIASGKGAVPLTTAPRGMPVGGSMPGDTLPHVILDINPTALADGAQLVDSSLSPATLFGSYITVQGGRINVVDSRYGFVQAVGNDGRFNFGAKDWSISIDVILSSKASSDPTAQDSAMLITRAAKGVAPGLLQVFAGLYGTSTGTEAPTSGTIFVFEDDFGSGFGQQVLQSQPGMNDGVRRTLRIARAGGTFYLGVDEKLVDINPVAGALSDVNTSVPLQFGPIRGSFGRITVKTSA